MDTPASVAFDPRAPERERFDAQQELTKAVMPSSVDGGVFAMAKWVKEQVEEQEFQKALTRPFAAPLPSKAVKDGKAGIQSVWLDDLQINLQGNFFERPTAFGFEAMRSMVHQTPILSAIIMTRQRQVARFCRPNERGGRGEGFHIVNKNSNDQPTKDEQQSILRLQDFFSNCGWEKGARQRMRLKRDNFTNFMMKLTRDTLTLDSMPIETEWARDKSLGLSGMYAVDGATIRLCSEQGYDGDDEIFAVQVVQGQVRTAYTYDDLIYVPRNPRTDVIGGGYGLSETELLIRIVTAFLNALSYNSKYFDSNQIPKGLLHLTGNYGEQDLAAFKRYWSAMVKGINNSWSLPVLVSKDQESKASFEKFGVDIDEMAFGKFMSFLTSIACAVYAIDPSEICFESFTTGASSLSGDNTGEKLAASKDKGLVPLLSYYENLFTDYVVSEFGDKFCFRFTGLDDEDQAQIFERHKLVLTVNEMRALDNLDKITDPWGDAPLNPSLIGAWQQGQQQGQEDYGQPGEDGEPPPGAQGAEPPQPDDEGKPAQPDEPEGDAPPEDADTIAKAFGLPALPIYRVE